MLLAFLRLPSEVRAEAKAADETGLLELAHRLSSSPHGDRAIARAAAAWHHVRRGPSGRRSWTRIAPHVGILAHVPEIARELDALRRAASGHGAGGSAVVRDRPPVRTSSTRLHGALATSSHPVEEPSSIVLADGLLHVNGVASVAVVHRVAEDAHEVRLHPVQSGRTGATVLRLTSDREWTPVAAVASGVELHLLTTEAEHHVVSFGDGIAVRDEPSLDFVEHLPRHVAREGRLVAIGGAPDASADYVVSGAAQPTTARIRASSLELRRGGETVPFTMPLVDPLMVIDSPKRTGDAPVLLELEPGSDRVFVWQQTAEDLWRGFRLQEEGVPIAARTLPSRGVLVVTRSSPRDLRIERLVLEGEQLRAARPLHVERGLGVVVDTARRHAWAVGLDETTLRLSVQPIGLRHAHGSAPA